MKHTSGPFRPQHPPSMVFEIHASPLHTPHQVWLLSCLPHRDPYSRLLHSVSSKSFLRLVKFGTNAYPLQSLSGVLDCMSNATVKSQWSRQSIQVVEEFCKREQQNFKVLNPQKTKSCYILQVTFILLCKVVCYLPVLVAVQDTVGDVQVICCHLVDALGNADEGCRAAGTVWTPSVVFQTRWWRRPGSCGTP